MYKAAYLKISIFLYYTHIVMCYLLPISTRDKHTKQHTYTGLPILIPYPQHKKYFPHPATTLNLDLEYAVLLLVSSFGQQLGTAAKSEPCGIGKELLNILVAILDVTEFITLNLDFRTYFGYTHCIE